MSGSSVGRYVVTHAGRSALKRLLAREQKGAVEEGAIQDQHDAEPYRDQHAEYEYKDIASRGRTRRHRVNISESPLAILARKKDQKGNPYLSHRLVLAGERLREDFEVAQIGPRVTQNWDRFLTASSKGDFYQPDNRSDTSEAARSRLSEALALLGPGMSDIAFRCCCFLEGLESIEKRLGWSARSGKVVLKLALVRLAEFYAIPENKQQQL